MKIRCCLKWREGRRGHHLSYCGFVFKILLPETNSILVPKNHPGHPFSVGYFITSHVHEHVEASNFSLTILLVCLNARASQGQAKCLCVIPDFSIVASSMHASRSFLHQSCVEISETRETGLLSWQPGNGSFLCSWDVSRWRERRIVSFSAFVL